MMEYPPFEALGITPDYLTFGASAMRNMFDAWCARPTVRALPVARRRAYNRTSRLSWASRTRQSKRLA